MVSMVRRTCVALLVSTLCCAQLASCDGEPRPRPATDTDAASDDQDGGGAAGRCRHFDPERQPFFGDLHVHTALSLDANLQGTRLRPRDAYRFARGEQVGLPPYDASGHAARKLQLERPLDFAAVTDHAEFLGVVSACLDARQRRLRLARVCSPTATSRDSRSSSCSTRGWPRSQSSAPGYCAPCSDGERLSAARLRWRLGRDPGRRRGRLRPRPKPARFTSFVAYEWTGLARHRRTCTAT